MNPYGMSRNTNTRRNQPATLVKIKLKTRPQRRDSDVSSSIDLSDEDGYSAVEEISDDEDDDEDDVAAVEEENILHYNDTPKPETPRPQWQPEQEDDEDDDEDDQYEDNDSQSWNGIETEQSQSDFFDTAYNNTVERHVRFDVPSSDSDSTETEDDHADLFPDIFVSQTSLDPAFRRELENDHDESSNSETFWEYQGTYEEQPNSDGEEAAQRGSKKDAATGSLPTSAVGSPSAPNDEPSQELDGYETDGDTTDEEEIPEPLPRRRTRRPSQPMSDDSDSEIETIIKPQRGHPRSGRFRLDRSDKKPIAILNPVTRKMMIFTPHKRRQLDLSPEHFDFSQWATEEQSSPLLSNSANLMLSAMFPANGLGDFANLPAIGPAEAFFPFTSDNNTPDESSSTRGSIPEEDEAEKKLAFEDFIAWGDCESSDDEGVDSNWQPSSTPLRPTTAGSESDVLSHLNSETVGAFRRNQINQQLLLSRQATQDSLAFSGPLNYTTIKGLKSDRFDTAGMPLTPIRRQKKQASDTKSPLEAVSTKRKASGEASGHSHKRPNSISAVNNLRL